MLRLTYVLIPYLRHVNEEDIAPRLSCQLLNQLRLTRTRRAVQQYIQPRRHVLLLQPRHHLLILLVLQQLSQSVYLFFRFAREIEFPFRDVRVRCQVMSPFVIVAQHVIYLFHVLRQQLHPAVLTDHPLVIVRRTAGTAHRFKDLLHHQREVPFLHSPHHDTCVAHIHHHVQIRLVEIQLRFRAHKCCGCHQ